MVHASVLDVIHGGYDDDSEYEDECEEEEEDEESGRLQSGFRAMDITRATPEQENVGVEGSLNEDGEMSRDPSSRIVGVLKGKDGRCKNQKKKKKKKRKGDRRKQSVPREQVMSIERFVVQTCRRIEETKYPLFREAVDRIGVEAMKALLNQVDVIEKCGGQMTADGLRRRSAGGVLWNLLRDHVGPVLYKEIMKEGNRKHIEQQRARQKERENERGNGKRLHMDVDSEGDDRQNVKRCRTSVDVDDPAGTTAGRPGRGISRETLPHVKRDYLISRDRLCNVHPAALQNAWIQGLKKQSERGVPSGDDILNPKPSDGKGPAGLSPTDMKRPVSERIRMTVSYGDLVEGEVEIASPIYGVTEVENPGVEDREGRDEMKEGPGNVREEGEMEEEGEVAD